ncbi:ABC transporter permease [Psychromonas ossibalaenae]|uniref:ABC transporter permease n=1 Tax=Psychromonas ossibalaenae TaxID=444922 RepID=UPI00037AF6A9|nr:ABC transporter permease [Psychromonas ossibalaenae]
MIPMLQQIVQMLFAHRLRSLLAITAVVWGIVSVLVLMALGEGFYQINARQFSLLMSDTQLALPEVTSKPWKGRPARREISFTEPEFRLLEKQSAIKAVSVLYQKWDASVTDITGHTLPGYIRGVDNHYIDMRKIKLAAGSRNISRHDINRHSRITVIGWQLAQQGGLSIGDKLRVNGIPFIITGITRQSEGGMSMGREDNQVLIPSSTFTDLWSDKPVQVMVTPAPGISGVVLRKNLLSFFASQKHFDPSDKRAMWLPDFSQDVKFFTTLLRGIQLFLGASGAMTLAVGALGVANIMFLSVTERTREIGVRLAIGATPTNILVQFLLEGGMLVSIGTVIGVAVSYVLILLMNQMGLPDWLGTPVISVDAVLMALSVTVVLALLASFFPARRAANLIPVTALSARA